MYIQTSSGNENLNRFQERSSNFSQEFDLGLFLLIVRKNIKWIILFFIIGYFSAFVYLRYTLPLYEASTVLQMTSQNTAKKVLDVENIYEQDIAGEIELLRSKVFISKALSRTNLEISYFAKGKILNYEMYTASPYTVEIKNVNPAVVNIPIYISFPNLSKIYTSYTIGDKVIEKAFELNHWMKLKHLEVKVTINDYSRMLSQQNQFEQNPYFFTVNNVSEIIDNYYHNVDVKLLNEAAQTIQVSIRENNPKKASDIVNSIAEEFIDYDVTLKAKSANKVLDFIDDQLKLVYENLRTSENKMQFFKKQNKPTKQGDFITLNIDRLDNIEGDLMNLDLEETLLNDVKKTISNEKEIDVYNLLPALTGASYQEEISKLVSSLHELLSKKEQALYVVTPESEEIKSLNYQIGIQKKMLLASIQALGNKIKIKKEGLNKKKKEIEDKFYNLPTQELEYARLLRLFSINEKFYTNLLEKKAEYAISKAGFVSKNVILKSSSTPTMPISPDENKIIAACLVAAVILSALLLVIRYLLHDEITSISDINKGVKAAILGIIPAYKKDIPVSQLLVDKNPKSLIAEAFRSVRTNLQFISNEPGPKIIGLTSTVSGEGKTFVSINLAGIIAFSDKKVIVLDLDLRKPKIHLGFNTENKKGISTILNGSDPIEDCINNSSIKNLDFITAGPIPPNPSELIISRKMDELIEYLKTKYDVIVIDNPPVGIVTDGISIIQRADYPIYVFKANFSKKNYMQNVDRLINESNIKRLSIILNGVDAQSGYGRGYNYGYGYGYTYGYGYYDEESELKKKSWFKKVFG